MNSEVTSRVKSASHVSDPAAINTWAAVLERVPLLPTTIISLSPPRFTRGFTSSSPSLLASMATPPTPHRASLRTREISYGPSGSRSALNIPALYELIIGAQREPVVTGKGKKRSSPPAYHVNKRTKHTSDISSTPRTSSPTWSASQYPSIRDSDSTIVPLDEETSVSPIPHEWDMLIEYSNFVPARYYKSSLQLDNEDAKKHGWTQEEEHLRTLIESVDGRLDLGPVYFTQHRAKTIAWSDMLEDKETYVLSVPTPRDSLMDHAMLTQSTARTKLAGYLSLEPDDDEVVIQGNLQFTLRLRISVAFIFPTFYRPISLPDEHSHHTLSLERALAFLVNHFYPHETQNLPEFNGHIDIPFFYSALQPAPTLPSQQAVDALQPYTLLPTLLPFQRRSVAWLLKREGKTIGSDGRIVDLPRDETFWGLWDEVSEGNHTFYIDRASGTIAETKMEKLSSNAFGGILAEEPGLGKTLETIALILLNPSAPEYTPEMIRWDPEAKLDVKAIKATLIVTPPALAIQWRDELRLHAPTLKVLFYEGWNKLKMPITSEDLAEERARRRSLPKAKSKSKSKSRAKGKGKASDEDEDELMDWTTFAHSHDVIITTYKTLQTDVHVARAARERPRREDVVYSNTRRRSPLVMVEWNRVVMDEVQMAGAGNVEEMVSLIPRRSSVAVSGTPARAQVADLVRVMKFLRVNLLTTPPGVWQRVCNDPHLFTTVFQHYAVRTTKASVDQELTIPPQTRWLVPIEMGKVERTVYDQALEEELTRLGVDVRGVASSEGWDMDGVVLRAAIRRLRGICTHPQIGQLGQRVGDRFAKDGALKSMEEVLEAMQEQNWKVVCEDAKDLILLIVRQAQLIQLDIGNGKRYQQGLDLLLRARERTDALLKDITSAFENWKKKAESLKAAAKAKKAADREKAKDKGKGRELFSSSDAEGSDEEDEEDEEALVDSESELAGLPKTPAGKEHRSKGQGLLNRLRETKLLFHRVRFLQGDAYHSLGNKGMEDEAYEDAERVRRELLLSAEKDAKSAMKDLITNSAAKKVTQRSLQTKMPLLEPGSIRTESLVEECEEIIDDIINEQGVLLWEWRTEIKTLLTAPLNSNEGEGDSQGDDGQGVADGAEYQRSLDSQIRVELFMQQYNALIADRKARYVAERTLLNQHDQREKRLRKTQAAIKAAADADMEENPLRDVELPPEQQVVKSELKEKRTNLLELHQGRALRSIEFAMRDALQKIPDGKAYDPERNLIKMNLEALHAYLVDEAKLMEVLNADLALMRKAFNQRILYFRQLQEISDSVAEVGPEEGHTIAESVEMANEDERGVEAKIKMARARQRYLDTLAKNKGKIDDDEEEQCCTVCKCEFARGYLTQCAHVFCEPCLKAWISRGGARLCPVCRSPIDVNNLQPFTTDEPQAPPPPQIVNGVYIPKSRRVIEYNIMDRNLFAIIQNQESYGDFGNKVQSVVRHLLYLQDAEPGCKSIVFSAWADSLLIMQQALAQNGIKSIRIDQSRGKIPAPQRFKDEADISVLLLHGERENAGLNVTCASRVFLLESVVHHGFEIQAIARIDRMGQKKPTEVYCYYTENTLEKNILDLAAKKGLSLYTKDNSVGTLDSSFAAKEEQSQEVEAPNTSKTKKAKAVMKGDFVMKMEDMQAILWPHMFEDVEYLIDPEDIDMHDGTSSSSSCDAVAGPSNLQR
ncbi:SNF2 family N-terminal domain-containing protein [Flagelloscypha sp. PMI_526]|nr:SNF2 family N-terminal domain-containing protein [Flagelloscypha sp. PMI_526]